MPVAVSEGLAHATSGALASAIAFSLLFPLDQLRLRRQCLVRQESTADASARAVLRQVLRDEGVRGLYTGLPPSVFAIVVANFFYFFYYNLLRQRLQRRKSGPLSGSHALTIPALAGALNVLSLNPLFVVSARLRTAAAGETGTLAGCLRQLRREGVGALWGGVVPSLWLVSNPTIQYFVYERLKAALRKRANRNLTSLEIFLAGAVSKTAAT
eukprot:2052600-Prymnesium_polylepis.1